MGTSSRLFDVGGLYQLSSSGSDSAPVFIPGCVVWATSLLHSWNTRLWRTVLCVICPLAKWSFEIAKITHTVVPTSVGIQGTPLSQTKQCACAEHSITGAVANARIRTQPTWREKVPFSAVKAGRTYVISSCLCRKCYTGFLFGLRCYVSRCRVNSEGLIGPACHAALSWCELR